MLSIRPARPNDAPFMRQVFIESTRATSESYYPREVIDTWSSEVTVESLERGIDDPANTILVAETNGIICGFGKLSLRRCEIDALYVDPKCQGMGVGRALMNAILDICTEHNMQEVELNASLPAVEFYERVGFQVVKEDIYTLSNGFVMSIKRMERNLSTDG